MKLYLFENYKEIYPELTGVHLTDKLINDALKAYEDKEYQIRRTEKGKPYVDGSLHFSVSHSEEYFVCLVSDVNVGVDIQKKRETDIYKLSKRFFTEDEKKIVDEKGNIGFFRVWTRKEAYCKFTERGLQEILAKTSVVDRNDVEFIDFELEEGLYCSCCYDSNELIKGDGNEI